MMNIIRLDGEECARLRKSLLTMVRSAVQNEENLLHGYPSGSEISDCLDIVEYLDEKGGNHADS